VASADQETGLVRFVQGWADSGDRHFEFAQ
jgi:hypothetical protein